MPNSFVQNPGPLQADKSSSNNVLPCTHDGSSYMCPHCKTKMHTLIRDDSDWVCLVCPGRISIPDGVPLPKSLPPATFKVGEESAYEANFGAVGRPK